MCERCGGTQFINGIVHPVPCPVCCDPTPKPYAPWHPMDCPIDLKHMGKLGEEAGELATVAARCIIQGVDSTEPTTGKVNRVWLEDEMADVLVNINLCIERFNLDEHRIRERMAMKYPKLKTWHEMA